MVSTPGICTFSEMYQGTSWTVSIVKCEMYNCDVSMVV